MEGFVVYAIYNKKHKKFYIGQTADFEVRLKLHNERKIKGYTARFDGEWEVIYTEKVGNRQIALAREKQLKSYRGRQFIKNLIHSGVALRQLAEVAPYFFPA